MTDVNVTPTHDQSQPPSYSLQHPGPLSGPNPFGFADLRAARLALRRHIGAMGDAEMHELGSLTRTIDALATASGEMRDERLEISIDGFIYLADKLIAAHKQLQASWDRAWQLAAIVEQQDLDALSRFRKYQDEE